MQIPVGTEVVILESGITGVLDHYDGSTAFILAGGEMHQIHKKDMAPIADFGKTVSPKDHDLQNSRTDNNRHDGLVISWNAVQNLSGEIQHFEVFFHNGMPSAVLLEYHFWLNEEQHTAVRKNIPSGTHECLHMIRPDQMNDRPVADVKCWKKRHDQLNALIADTEIRIRVKQYVVRLQSSEFKQSGILLFDIPLLKPSPSDKDKMVIETVQERDIWKQDIIPVQHEVIQKATMSDTIDLHADKLLPNVRNMEPGEILHFQIRAFRQFLEKAIRLRMHRIYAIHGLGTGKLRQEIETALEDYPEVSSFNNDYNPRFGFGATEITLD